MSNILSQKSLNMLRNATLVNPNLTGIITLPATSGLKTQELTGYISSIVSADAIVAVIPVLINGTLTRLSVVANAAAAAGEIIVTFYRVNYLTGAPTAITNGVITIGVTDLDNVPKSVTVSEAFVYGDSLKAVVSGANTNAGNAGIAGLFTVA
jgi:hypothetical protein